MGNKYRIFNEINNEIKRAMYVDGFEDEIEEVSKFIFLKDESFLYTLNRSRA